jgi:hypothetical protein
VAHNQPYTTCTPLPYPYLTKLTPLNKLHLESNCDYYIVLVVPIHIMALLYDRRVHNGERFHKCVVLSCADEFYKKYGQGSYYTRSNGQKLWIPKMNSSQDYYKLDINKLYSMEYMPNDGKSIWKNHHNNPQQQQPNNKDHGPITAAAAASRMQKHLQQSNNPNNNNNNNNANNSNSNNTNKDIIAFLMRGLSKEQGDSSDDANANANANHNEYDYNAISCSSIITPVMHYKWIKQYRNVLEILMKTNQTQLHESNQFVAHQRQLLATTMAPTLPQQYINPNNNEVDWLVLLHHWLMQILHDSHNMNEYVLEWIHNYNIKQSRTQLQQTILKLTRATKKRKLTFQL